MCQNDAMWQTCNELARSQGSFRLILVGLIPSPLVFGFMMFDVVTPLQDPLADPDLDLLVSTA